MSDSARISPTAHYTGYVWTRAGLSVEALRTPQGALLHAIVTPTQWVGARALEGVTLDAVLLQRHIMIDALLADAIEQRGVTRVLEIAGGLSARGLRFASRYPHIRYVEGDLPGMAARKRRMLRTVATPSNHAVVAIDALRDEGANSIFGVGRRELAGEGGVAVITEGLLNYFDREAVEGMWRRFARFAANSGGGVYLADLHLREETERYPLTRLFLEAIGVFARGAMHLHFADESEALGALRSAGFEPARLHRPSEASLEIPRTGLDMVRVVEARIPAT